MARKVQVAILGAGSAGLSARGEVRKTTDDYVVINSGPHGTTCARVGCMPSKVLIQAANDFHRRHKLAAEGIHGGEQLSVDSRETMKFVRSLRDRFVRGVMGTIEDIGDKNIDGFAKFVDTNVLEVNGERITAEKIIIAVGSRPILFDQWTEFGDKVLTSDTIFEQEELPQSVAVVGTGVIGLELGQALSRLGVKVHLCGRAERVSGLSDPAINQYAIAAFRKEFDLVFGGCPEFSLNGERIKGTLNGETYHFDKILAAPGRRLNTDGLGLENIGVELDARGLPRFNRHTMQVEDLPIYIAGDINAERAILHEASDEGKIAGYNAVRSETSAFERSTPLYVTFTDPEIALVGASYKELQASGAAFESGEVSFEGQGRSLVMQKNVGLLHVYGEKGSGRLLGAEMVGPHTEHLAHLLAWSIEQKLSVFDVLKFPFYHPVVEEGLRTALRDLAQKVDPDTHHFELRRLDTPPGADVAQ